MSVQEDAAPELKEYLVRAGLAANHDEGCWAPLTGGVSSDIWRVKLPGRTLCIKRALAKLKVAADWEAPVSRNAYEWEWMKFAAGKVPDAVPRPIAHDLDAGLFAMEYLEPEDHPVWKQQLLDGHVDPNVAGALGKILGRLHLTSADSVELARQFDTNENFEALRLAPYLKATADRHPRLAAPLLALAERTGAIHVALVHGDVSPKNILIGPKGPVILDAECAWYGDPAFDVAFLLNHLLLKCLVNPHLTDSYLVCFSCFADHYFGVDPWLRQAEIESRAAALLPALLLARVDGKSPVEYVTEESAKDLIRHFAADLITAPSSKLADIAAKWRDTV